MNKHDCHSPDHESPKELRIRAIVDGVVSDESQKQAYVAFAEELMLAERRPTRLDSPEFRNQIPEFRMRTGQNPLATGRPFPDYTRRTKNVVAKWFRRGLSGRLMWLIGQEVLFGQEVHHGG